jgi:multisubunit Na+/H+ antiporter MnhG subunit
VNVLVVVFLVVAIASVVVSAAGMAAMTNVYDRMHYLGPASMIAPVAVAAAVVAREGLSAAGIKAVLVAVVISATSPVLTHATGRAARIRELGHWAPTDDERGDS